MTRSGNPARDMQKYGLSEYCLQVRNTKGTVARDNAPHLITTRRRQIERYKSSLSAFAEKNRNKAATLSRNVEHEKKRITLLRKQYEYYLHQLEIEAESARQTFEQLMHTNSTWWHLPSCSTTKDYLQNKHNKNIKKINIIIKLVKIKITDLEQLFKHCTRLA